MTKTKTDKAIAKKKLIKEKQKKVAGTAEIKTKPLHERMCTIHTMLMVQKLFKAVLAIFGGVRIFLADSSLRQC